jgi:hypothetical protein
MRNSHGMRLPSFSAGSTAYWHCEPACAAWVSASFSTRRYRLSGRTGLREKDHLDHAAHHGDDYNTDKHPELPLTGGPHIADFLTHIVDFLA